MLCIQEIYFYILPVNFEIYWHLCTAVTQCFPTVAETTLHIVMRYEKMCLSDPKVFLRDDKRIGVIILKAALSFLRNRCASQINI